MRVIASNIALVAWVAVGYGAWGQEASRLLVERGVGAEPCPDSETLSSRIDQIRGRSSRDLAGSYRVSFVHKTDGFAAVISTGPTGANVRTLESNGPTCAELAKATALTLALLFDSDVAVKKNPPPVVSAAPPPVPPPPPPPPSPEVSSFHRDATLSLGAIGLAGVVRTVSPAASVEAGIAGRRWRMGIGALWGVPQTLDLTPGTVDEKLMSGTLRTCFAPYRQGWVRFDVCTGAFVGFMSGEAQGFTHNEQHTRPWVAVPFELVLAGWNAPVGWELGAGALVPVRRQDFSVDGLGVAYKSPPMAGMLSLRVVGMLGW
jgi:hypothetical protein